MSLFVRAILRSITVIVLGLSCADAKPKLPSPADGIYKPTKLEAYVVFAGKRINLPLDSVRDALLRDGLILVRDRRIPIRKSKWEVVLEKMKFLGIKGNARVSSPDSLVFRNRVNRPQGFFFGKTIYPMRVIMKGRYKWAPVTVTLSSKLDSTIKGDSLVIDSPLKINVSGVVTAKGRIRLSAERQTILPPGIN